MGERIIYNQTEVCIVTLVACSVNFWEMIVTGSLNIIMMETKI